MNRIIKIGMDVHSTKYTLCAMEPIIGSEDRIFGELQTASDYKEVIAFINSLKLKLDLSDKDSIECGYEAGCLGYTLYNQLTNAGIKCVILAPTTMLTQQINAFALRHGHQYPGTKWTCKHIIWLRKLELNPIYRETLNEYMASYDEQEAKIARYDARIEEIAAEAHYKENVEKLCCFLGIRTHTALSLIVETGDFKRFAKGNTYGAFLGLVPGEHSSADKINRLCITKAGNSHLRTLLIEAAKGICKGQIGRKSKALRARQNGQSAEVIAYADKANTRLRSKYYRMIRHGKKKNVAVAAVARELACFVWGMMTGNISVTGSTGTSAPAVSQG